MRSHSSLIWLAIVLFAVWIILRLALAMTGGALHLLWIGAILFLIVWFIQNLSGRGRPSV